MYTPERLREFKTEDEWIHYLVERDALCDKLLAHIKEIALWADAYDMRGVRLAVASCRAFLKDTK